MSRELGSLLFKSGVSEVNDHLHRLPWVLWWFRKTHSLAPKPFTLSTLDHLYNLQVWYLAVIGVSCMFNLIRSSLGSLREGEGGKKAKATQRVENLWVQWEVSCHSHQQSRWTPLRNQKVRQQFFVHEVKDKWTGRMVLISSLGGVTGKKIT
jgi:hypothetical protein